MQRQEDGLGDGGVQQLLGGVVSAATDDGFAEVRVLDLGAGRDLLDGERGGHLNVQGQLGGAGLLADVALDHDAHPVLLEHPGAEPGLLEPEDVIEGALDDRSAAGLVASEGESPVADFLGGDGREQGASPGVLGGQLEVVRVGYDFADSAFADRVEAADDRGPGSSARVGDEPVEPLAEQEGVEGRVPDSAALRGVVVAGVEFVPGLLGVAAVESSLVVLDGDVDAVADYEGGPGGEDVADDRFDVPPGPARGLQVCELAHQLERAAYGVEAVLGELQDVSGLADRAPRGGGDGQGSVGAEAAEECGFACS